MSARRGRKARTSPVLTDPDHFIEIRTAEDRAEDRAATIRAAETGAEWLRHALCTDPADRPAAEEAITGLYRLLDRPPPGFVWVDSPHAAVEVLPPQADRVSYRGPWLLENELATLVSNLKQRLADRCGGRRHDLPVRDVLRRTVAESVAGLIRRDLPARLGLLWYGQQEADWIAHYDAHRPNARFRPGDEAQLDLWAAVARSCGWWWPREGVCVIAERPSAIHTEPLDDGLRLHHDSGPAVEFRDGCAVHVWHGTRVPSWVVDDPSADRIDAEANVEVRRCAIERIGWEAYLDRAGLRLLARAPDPGNPGSELQLYDLSQWQGARTRLLPAVNGSLERDGTRRRYGLGVPPWFDDPVDAAGWSYGLTGAQYAGLLRRT
ncbi:hypothetical protein FHS29_000161 [Saccharothrix tamanrassetensis]|uniref:DUF6745 domain-containing protein n=1 Tax=Saccharothrix tamanrassetensis TaxID=1051531 RepID=A0A841C8Z0_9PSEU|nr:hypothetical protein [Saccharothrix tamanrassetensis]MBB5953591.1 hypothetical protein [Saccharothrix tamanrassetensis]